MLTRFRLGTACHFCSPNISGINASQEYNVRFQHAPRHLVLPASSVPMFWIEPRPSLHTILWTSAVQGSTKMPADRTKTIIDPLAVMSMDVHDVYSAFTNSTMSASGSSGVKIPSGQRRLYACVNPVTAGMVVHRRVDKGLSENVMNLWRQKQIAWSAATGGEAASKRSVEDIYGNPMALQELCDYCDCGGDYCRTNESQNVVDFSLTNLFGALIVSEIDTLIKSDFRLP